jgi:hypothetical protein
MYGRILGLSPQADSNRVVSNIIDLPVNDFAFLAAVDPILRQSSVISVLRTNDDVSTREQPMTIGHAKSVNSDGRAQLGVRALRVLIIVATAIT